MDLEFPYSLKELALGGVLPMTVVFAVSAIVLRSRCSDALGSLFVNVAIAGSVLLGARLVSLPGWRPTSHWHWLPWCGIATAAVSPLLTDIVALQRLLEKWFSENAVGGLLRVFLAVGTAYLIVPDWDAESMSRHELVRIVGLLIFAVSMGLHWKAGRIDQRLLATVLAGSAMSATCVLTMAGSLRLALVSLPIAAAFTAQMLASLVVRRQNPFLHTTTLFAVLVVGVVAMRRLNSDTGLPLVCFLLPPIAPLMLWATETGYAKQLPAKVRLALQIALPALPAIAAVVIAMAAMFGASDDGY